MSDHSLTQETFNYGAAANPGRRKVVKVVLGRRRRKNCQHRLQTLVLRHAEHKSSSLSSLLKSGQHHQRRSNMDKYILSFQALRPYEYTEPPPWWAFWRKPTTYKKDVWMRFAISLTEEEGLRLLRWQGSMNYHPVWTLTFKCLANVGPDNIKHVQIEEIVGPGYGRTHNQLASEYVSTTN